MDNINYDDLYENAVVDFSNRYGLKHKITQNSETQPEYSYLNYYNNNVQESQYEQNNNAQNQNIGTSQNTSEPVKQDYSKFNGFEQFNRLYDKVQAYNPDAAKYRNILTKIASLESSFRPGIKNNIGAAGYFQFMENTRKSIMKKLGKPTDLQYFISNPEIQILAAIQLAKDFENSFSKEDLQLAQQNGHTLNGLISGAWLGGVGGVRRYLRNGKDASDGGTTVSKRIKIGDVI